MSEEPNPYATPVGNGQVPPPRLDSDAIAFGKSLKLAKVQEGLLFFTALYGPSTLTQVAITDGAARGLVALRGRS